jgi:AraC-like protein
MQRMSPSADAPVVRFVRPLRAPGLELVHYPGLTRGWRGIPEAYTWFTFIESLEGDVDVLSRGMSARCEPGSVTIGEPGEPYVLRPSSPMLGDFRVVRVDNQLRNGMLEDIGVRRSSYPFPRRPQSDPRLARAFAALFRAIDAGELLPIQERLFAFLGLAARAERAFTDSGARGAEAVRRARELLYARLDGTLSLDELAARGRHGQVRAPSRILAHTRDDAARLPGAASDCARLSTYRAPRAARGRGARGRL